MTRTESAPTIAIAALEPVFEGLVPNIHNGRDFVRDITWSFVAGEVQCARLRRRSGLKKNSELSRDGNVESPHPNDYIVDLVIPDIATAGNGLKVYRARWPTVRPANNLEVTQVSYDGYGDFSHFFPPDVAECFATPQEIFEAYDHIRLNRLDYTAEVFSRTEIEPNIYTAEGLIKLVATIPRTAIDQVLNREKQ